jgi:hypothetical protein
MKTSAQINIERLSKDDRTALWHALHDIEHVRRLIHDRALNYEGRLHTALDRIELELSEPCDRLASLLGQKQLELLSESVNLNSTIKSSV